MTERLPSLSKEVILHDLLSARAFDRAKLSSCSRGNRRSQIAELIDDQSDRLAKTAREIAASEAKRFQGQSTQIGLSYSAQLVGGLVGAGGWGPAMINLLENARAFAGVQDAVTNYMADVPSETKAALIDLFRLGEVTAVGKLTYGIAKAAAPTLTSVGQKLANTLAELRASGARQAKAGAGVYAGKAAQIPIKTAAIPSPSPTPKPAINPTRTMHQPIVVGQVKGVIDPTRFAKPGSATINSNNLRTLIASPVDLDVHAGGSWNGHALQRHAGAKVSYLEERLINDPALRNKIGAIATSFPDKQTADWAVAEVLNRNEGAVLEWFNGASINDRKTFTSSFGQKMGYGVERGNSQLLYLETAKIVVVKTPSGLKVVTAFLEK